VKRSDRHDQSKEAHEANHEEAHEATRDQGKDATMFGVPLNKVSLSQRDLVKKVYYLHQYGGTVPHFPFVTNPPTANAVVPAWRTKDGRVIPVSTMSDAHLANAMAMLYRKLGPLMAEANKRAQECHEVRSGGAVDSCLSDVDFGDLF
jgi:hypothetical protein